jgi:hypothetical protein
MRISGHKTRSVFDRYNIIDESDLKFAVRKLQKFQDAAQPQGHSPQPESPVAAPRALVNLITTHRPTSRYLIAKLVSSP